MSAIPISLEHPPQRIDDHEYNIPEKARRKTDSNASLYPRYASGGGVQPNFRLLAVFPLGTNAIYGQLLGALFMILLNSFQDSHGTCSRYAP